MQSYKIVIGSKVVCYSGKSFELKLGDLSKNYIVIILC